MQFNTRIDDVWRISAAGEATAADDHDLQVKQEINSLKLCHVHGYRGFDCRDNLFYINDGTTVVYHAAASGIVLDLVTCKLLKKNQSIFKNQ